MSSLRVQNFCFDAAHLISSHLGKCKHLHGHTYRVDIEVEGETNGCMIIDSLRLKSIVKMVLKTYDHKLLVPSESKPLSLKTVSIEKKVINGKETTVENIAEQLAIEISNSLPSNIRKMRVRVYEGYNTSAEKEIIRNKGGGCKHKGNFE